MSQKQVNQLYVFYKKKGVHPHLDTSRVYPFSHTYGTNIAIQISPLKQTFHSAGASTLKGVSESDVTVQDYFGTPTPKLEPMYILTYENNPLGVRFQAVPTDSAFLFDVELGKLTPQVQQLLLSRLPKEEMALLPTGDFTTTLEQVKRLYIVDVSECPQITAYLNNYYNV